MSAYVMVACGGRHTRLLNEPYTIAEQRGTSCLSSISIHIYLR